MSQNPGLPTHARSSLTAVLDGIAAGARRLAGSVRRSFSEQRTPAELQAYNEGFDAGICSNGQSPGCPYVREKQAKQWREGFQSGWSQAW